MVLKFQKPNPELNLSDKVQQSLCDYQEFIEYMNLDLCEHEVVNIEHLCFVDKYFISRAIITVIQNYVIRQ